MKRTSPSPEAGDLEAGMDVNAVGSLGLFYEQVYASLSNEMEVISQFRIKLEVSKEEGRAIHDAVTLKIVRDTMEKDVKEASETAHSIIEKLEQLDTVRASNKGCKEDSPTHQSFTNMRDSYITQVEEVLNVVSSRAGVETQSTDEEDSTYGWSNTDSVTSMRKRLEGLRTEDSLAGAEIQRVDRAEVFMIQLQGVAKRFSYDELQMATRGFSEKLGDGGFGSVYRGVLPPCIPVAVKRMNAHSTHGQGMKEFKGEVSIITQLRHRNLIELQGWCEDQARKEYMLVYDLMPNGSLDNLLFKHSVKRGAAAAGEEGTEARGGKGGVVKGTFSLSWPQRFNILTEIADALDYLHQGWKHQVIHGDIKCANILLDKEWNAKLTDFGLSRLVDHQGEAYTIHFAGTRGYAAPELYIEGKFTDKSDVFAFGAVVLEVVCGRRNWPGDAYEMSLVEWVRERLSKGDVISIVDKELRGFDRDQMETVLMIGLACCDIDLRKRPSMRLVVKMLAGDRHDELMKMMVVKEKAEDVPGPSKEAPSEGEDFFTSYALNVDFEAKDQESENIAYVLPPPPPPLLPPLPPKWKEAIDSETAPYVVSHKKREVSESYGRARYLSDNKALGAFEPVYQQGDPGQGIGGYDLKSPCDRVFTFDYDHSGKLDHIVLYRPGTGTIWILKHVMDRRRTLGRRHDNGNFCPVYAEGDPGRGIGGYNLDSVVDRAFAFDYDHSGKLDHLVLYRPGTGTMWILQNRYGVFSPVYHEGDPGNGIGGYDLRSCADRAFAFDYNHNGKLDHLALYRPGTGTIWILQNRNGAFTPVFQQGDPGHGIGGYDLRSAADKVFAFDYDHSGKLDHVALFRPGTGTIWILKNRNGAFTPVYRQRDPGSGIGGYDLKSPADDIFAFDYEHSGKFDYLVLYRPGTGTIWILKNRNGDFSPVYQQGDSGRGIGGYDLRSPADKAFAYNYSGKHRSDYIGLYRPGTGTIWILSGLQTFSFLSTIAKWLTTRDYFSTNL